MSFPLTCRVCGTRLKLPPGCTKKKARCPRCDARIDLRAALDAATYVPDSVTATILGDAPLPAAHAVPAKPSRPEKPAAPAPADPARALPMPVTEREEDPLPYLDLNPAAHRPAPPPVPAGRDPGLALDPMPTPPEGGSPSPPPAAPPFRTPVRVTADSAGLFAGPCEAVLVPHGLFLESVPYRPFLYAPLRCPVEAAGGRGFAFTLPDGRRVTLQFLGPNAGSVADESAAFLAGERPMPDPRAYRRNPRWLLWLALIFAAALAVGPAVMSQTTELGQETGLLIGAGFAAAGLLANAAVVLLTRLSVPGKVVLMATVGLLMTGVFLFGATAYLAGRQEAEQAQGEPPPPKPPELPPPVFVPERRSLPTAIDRAYAEGVYRFEPGTDEVTAVGVTPDGTAMLVGYRNGETRVWSFDRLPDIDPFAPGPKTDGPVTRIDFDATSSVAYLTCGGGVVAAHWAEPPAVPLKIPGDLVAAHTFPNGERFAAVRGNGNLLVLRQLPLARVRKPDAKAKGPVLTLAPTDEVSPADVRGALAPPGQRPTFLAWHPTGKLLAGLSNGNILSWGAAGPKSAVVSREHKAAVRAWSASPGTWDFATADEKGVVGLWENKAMTPRTFTGATGFAGNPVAINQMSFSPTGSFLALADANNTVWVWDLSAMRAVVKTLRPTPVRAIAYGPQEDLLLVSDGKTVDLWSLSELAKQP